MHEDVLAISKDLLGKYLVTQINGHKTVGKIVETEAYIAPDDRASHAYQWKRSPKNDTMYAIGGTCYMYICYGIHHLCNVITGPEGLPHAVLLRAIEPVENIPAMLERRNMTSVKKNLSGGPGLLSQALGLHKDHDTSDLTKQKVVWIEEGETIAEENIVQTTRIGIETAKEAVDYPYRFYIKDNPWVSRK